MEKKAHPLDPTEWPEWIQCVTLWSWWAFIVYLLIEY